MLPESDWIRFQHDLSPSKIQKPPKQEEQKPDHVRTEQNPDHFRTELLEARPEATAIVCYDDSCAVGVIHAIERSGRAVPDNVSVIGYDDSPVARMDYLGLTTLAQDPLASLISQSIGW